MVGTIQSTRKPAVQPGLFQSMASCMNRTFVVQMKAFQRNKPQSTIKTNPQPFFYRTGCRTSQIAETVTVSFQNQNRPTRKAFTKALASSPV